MASASAPPVRVREPVHIDDVIERLRFHERACDESWMRSIYDYASECHEGQKRRSGKAYISHPLSVAYVLADLKFDQTSVAVALLHDTLEDTGATRESLAEEFGEEIAALVDGVSKIGQHEYVRRDEAQAETFRKLILASAKDIRVIVVKLADRLHNMVTLEHLPSDKVRRIARETFEIYAPIAHRLGMSRIKGDLEDMAFFHLYPHQFTELRSKLDEKVRVTTGTMQRIRDELTRALSDAQVECEISYRVKRYYSIYQKLRRQRIDISELYDFLAFRVITTSLRDTYAALGVVHQSWRPIPGRFKDYIAMPKPNLYQSLHTTVVGDKGQPFEVQLRTQEMDVIAEEGIAAHWRYKEGRLDKSSTDPNIVWLRQLLEWQQEVEDPRTFLSTLKIDLYPEEVYVFSPKGDVLSFPRGATPLDFAYRVHTELGHHCTGARVNGRLIPLKTALNNGDIVEILTNPNREPSRDWLSFVVTSRAKSKIRQWLNTQQKERAVEIGRSLLERELKKRRSSLKRIADSEAFARYLKEEGHSHADDVLSRIGFGRIASKHVVDRVLDDGSDQERVGALRRVVDRILPQGDTTIVVKGHDDLLAFLAKCCSPLPGDEIVGYITRGRGVSVHSRECPNVQNLLYNHEREIDVAWARKEAENYAITLEILAEDQQGLLARVTEVIAKLGSNIGTIEAKTPEDAPATIEVLLQVRDRRHLERIQRAVEKIPGIYGVNRRMRPGAQSEKPVGDAR